MLSKARSAGFFPLAGVVPFGVKGFHLLSFPITEVEHLLVLAPARHFAEQGAFEQRLSNLFAGTRHRHGDTEVAFDAFVFADQDVQNDTVNRIVASIIRDDAHLTLLLTIPVNSPFPLFMPGGVPA